MEGGGSVPADTFGFVNDLSREVFEFDGHGVNAGGFDAEVPITIQCDIVG